MVLPHSTSRILSTLMGVLLSATCGCRSSSEPRLSVPVETASAPAPVRVQKSEPAPPAQPAPHIQAAPQPVSVAAAPQAPRTPPPTPASVQARKAPPPAEPTVAGTVNYKIDYEKHPDWARHPERARREEHLARLASLKHSDQIQPDRGVTVPNAGAVEKSLRWKSDLPEKLSPGQALVDTLAQQQADVREAQEAASEGYGKVPPIITVEGADDVILLPAPGRVTPRDILILLHKGGPQQFNEYQKELRGVMQRAMARPFDTSGNAQQSLVEDMQASMPWRNVYFETRVPGAQVWYVPEGDTIEVQASPSGPTPVSDKLHVGYYRIWTVRNNIMTGEQMVPIYQESQKVFLKENMQVKR